MPVFVGDNMHGALMISKVGSSYKVFRLKEVQVVYASYDYHHPKYKSIKWVWEKSATATTGYKPYDDEDVTRSPNSLLPYVKRMAQHKVRVMV